MWKKVSKKTLLEHPRITVCEDIVELPNGEKTDYLYFEGDNGASTIIVINEYNKILLQKEYSYPPNEILYQFPGGGINTNEAPIDAAKRELSEEANLSGEIEEIGWFYTDNRRKKSKMHVFVATRLTGSPGKLDAEEVLEDFWLTETEIDELISSQQLVIYSALSAWAIYKNYLLKK
ncbi:MAG: NUDIX hydrolase [Candidatus Saccharibacteria bacterium]|nr:NUDIX hydrolase [Candidatus Saccharibacteria bacterium]